MTAQMTEKVIYQGVEYSLIMWEEGQIFTPETYGMQPSMIHTACLRGYYVTYDLGEEGFTVLEFTLENGRITDFEDRSAAMEEMRKNFPGDPLNPMSYMLGLQKNPLFKNSQGKEEGDETG